MGLTLRGLTLGEPTLGKPTYMKPNLQGAILYDANLQGARLEKANVAGLLWNKNTLIKNANVTNLKYTPEPLNFREWALTNGAIQ